MSAGADAELANPDGEAEAQPRALDVGRTRERCAHESLLEEPPLVNLVPREVVRHERAPQEARPCPPPLAAGSDRKGSQDVLLRAHAGQSYHKRGEHNLAQHGLADNRSVA